MPTVTDAQGNTVYVRPYFFANKNAVDQTGIVTSAWTLATFPNVVSNQGGFYDPVTSAWTPPAGQYFIKAVVTLSAVGVVDQAAMIIEICKNNADHRQYLPHPGASSIAMSLSVDGVVEANGTDYFNIWVNLGGGALDKTILGEVVRTYFEGVSVD